MTDRMGESESWYSIHNAELVRRWRLFGIAMRFLRWAAPGVKIDVELHAHRPLDDGRCAKCRRWAEAGGPTAAAMKPTQAD